jgi:hypothetical protein
VVEFGTFFFQHLFRVPSMFNLDFQGFIGLEKRLSVDSVWQAGAK